MICGQSKWNAKGTLYTVKVQYCTVAVHIDLLLHSLYFWPGNLRQRPHCLADLFSRFHKISKDLDSLAKSSFLMTTVFLCFFMLLHFSAWPLWWLLQSEPVVPARHYNVLHNGDILHYQSLPWQLSPSHTKSHWTNWAAHLLDLFA